MNDTDHEHDPFAKPVFVQGVRCARYIQGIGQCPMPATTDVESIWFCDEHAAQQTE